MGIHLLFLRSYYPNLTLNESLWGFVLEATPDLELV